MSTRPNWFRVVVAVFVLAFTSLTVRIHSQELRISNIEPPDRVEKGLMQELFPYAMKSAPAEPGSADLITAGTYPFSVQTGVALEDMSSGTSNLLFGPALDDNASLVTNIGFDFWYDGVRQSQFSVNVNGLARLGATAVGTNFNNSTDGLGTTLNAPKIAPYFEDMCTGLTGKVHYKVVGGAPNRKLVVEWNGLQIPRGAGCTGFPATGVFQMWLFESAGSSNPGRIQFVYGGGINPSTATDLGASIGLQAGVATNFASVTVSDDSVSYAVANNTNLPGVPTGKSYIFTPNTPNAPTGLAFTLVTQSSMQLNWADNATNEVGYAIYRSTDGVNYSFLTQTAVDAVSFNDTGLVAGTTYFYRVHAVTEGALSSALSGSQATGAAGNDSCAGAGGNWSDTATWLDGSVPTAGDDVTIGSGCTVTVDTATAVALNVTIASGGVLQSPLAGTVTTNNLTVGGNVTNNGVLDFSTNADTSGAILTFVGPVVNATFGGSGATTDIRAITVNKGAGGSLELNPTNFTFLGGNTDTGSFLTLTSGTFKISGSFTMTNRLFGAAAYTIPATGGLWLSNPNFTVAGQNGSPTNNGILRVTTGTFNVGLIAGNTMGGGAGAQFIVEGGISNYAGRLQTASVVSYTQSGGIVNVSTVGNAAATASFGLTAAGNTFNMTGGSIVLTLPSSSATPLDYSVSTTATFLANPAGTTLQLGGGSTPPATTFRVLGATPNILINSGHSMAVGSGAAGAAVFMRGATVTNNGAIVVQGTGGSSRFDWAASGPMSYSGTGTFGTAVTPFAGVGMSANGGDTTLNSPIFVNRTNFFSGGFVNSNQITYGNGGASATVIQVGNSAAATNSGGFDVAPVYNTGTGGHILLHLRTTTLNRTVGFEMNPSRTLTQFVVDNNLPGATLALGAGDVTIPGTGAGSLTLNNGEVVVAGANTLFHNAGTVVRVAGFVNGRLSRSFTATGAYTYHVGANGYSPVVGTVTTLTTNPSSLSVSPVDNTLPGLNSGNAVSRYWSLSETGDLIADLAFTYLDADVNGTETDYRVWRLASGVLTNQCSGGPCVNDATNTATVTGVTDFSDWGIGEAGAGTPGSLAFSGSTYSGGENTPSVTVTVNRTGGSANTVTVDYASVAGGSATGGATCTAGVDYINAAGTLTFLNGETSKTFDVALCDDLAFEGDETVNLALANATGGATIGTPSTAVLTIVDNDPPIAANVVVNPGAGSYATLGEAIAAINAGTHTGAITVDIMANTTETGAMFLNSSGAGTASYTSIVIRPGADGVTVAGPTVTGRGLIELNGADNVTIDGDNPGTAGTNRNLTIQNTAANTITFTSVIRIAMNTTTVTSADNNIVRNLNVAGSATGLNIIAQNTTASVANTSYGIVATGLASGPTTAPTALALVTTTIGTGATATNLVISNNSYATAGRAISVQGSGTGVFPGLMIQNNSIGNPVAGSADQVYVRGISAQGSTNGVISGNTVYVEGFIGSSGSSATVGIDVGTISATGTFTIEKNKVNRVRNNEPQTWATYGINLNAGNNQVVRNNFVTDVLNNQVAGTGAFSTTFGAFGLRVGTGTGHQVYHNSVNMFGPLLGVLSTDLTAALGIVGAGQTGCDIRNNIFVNTVTGGNPTGTRNVAIFVPAGATSAMNLTLNNNDYFVGADAQNRMAQRGTTFGTGEFTLADFDPTTTTPATNFRSYSSTLSAAGTNDDSSKKVDPLFVSNTDLHLQAASTMQASGATVGVVDDIDGDTRQTPPDLGGDEIVAVGTPGTLAFSSATYSVGEAGPMVTLTVNRTGGSSGAVTATYSLGGGTATGGTACGGSVDYDNDGGIVSFADGETSKTFDVVICEDLVVEGNETFDATLSNPTGGATIGTPNPATVTITDNDVPAAGSLQFSSATYTVGEAGPVATMTVTRTGGTDGTVTVDFATVAGGTATGGAACTAGIDYVNASGTLTFVNGDASETFTVTICNDVTDEPDETVNMALANPTGGATLGTPNTAVLTITDDDGPTQPGGTIDVGTGQTYTSLTNTGGLFEAINTLGASSNLTINITSDLVGETGTVPLNEIPGGITVLIRPTGAARLITGASTNGLIKFSGADGVTIDGSLTGATSAQVVGGDDAIRNLTIQNTSTTATAGAVVSVLQGTNGANNFTIKNVKIVGQDPTQTLIGISIAGAAPGASPTIANNNGRIENCSIRRAFIGTFYNGPTAAPGTGAVITLNDLTGTGADRLRRGGIFFFNQNGIQVTLNDIGGIDSNEAADSIGIIAGIQNVTTTSVAAGGVSNANISRNRINGVRASSTTGFSAVGIAIAGTTTGSNTISNNMISGVIGPATSPDIVAGIFVAGVPSSDTRLYFNSVAITGDRGPVASQIGSYGVAISGTNPVVDMKDNIFYNTQTSGGGANAKSYSIGLASTTFTNFNSNFNDFFASGANAGFFRTGGLDTTATDHPNLAAFQAATSSNANSQEVDPLYVNPASNLHLQATSPVLDDGTPAGGIVVDFDGDARSATTPDIGADEVVSVGNPGTLQFSSATYSVGEAGPTATITVTRTGGTDGTVTVDFATVAGGTATGGAACTAGIDYVNASGTLTFVNGDASETFNVTICNDVTDEPDETINMALTNPTGGAVIGSPSTAVLTILDDDPTPPTGSFAINDVRVFEGNSGAVNAVFTVTYTGSPVPVSVQYATANGTAVAGVDYLSASGTLTFNSPVAPSGIPSQTQTITVLINGDTAKEANETYFVNLSNPTGATISDAQGVGIIIDEDRSYVADFDRDRVTDFSVFRPSEGRWYVLNSASSSLEIVDFGTSEDVAVPGDYDADGQADFAIWRPSTGTWYRILSSDASTQISAWGATGDKPVQGDYDGDGKTDLAVFRPSTGTWWILRSSDGGSSATPFGISTDRPVQGDYDGDAKTDIVVYRDGTWYISRSSDGGVQISNFGLAADRPVSGDFDGDGKFDLAIYRDGVWWILGSLTGSANAVPWGTSTDIPVPADYDADGTTDLAVFRPSVGDWFVIRSSNSTSFGVHWGVSGDVLVPAAYLPQ